MTIPQPYHRWSQNEYPSSFYEEGRKHRPDHCLVCGVVRHPLSKWAEELAAGPCPERPWREVWAEETA